LTYAVMSATSSESDGTLSLVIVPFAYIAERVYVPLFGKRKT
jgi:hypothetical protein